MTRHIPGTVGTGGVTGLGARLMILLQSGRGHAILCDELLQINKQLHGHLTYFFPGGAFLIGWNIPTENNSTKVITHRKLQTYSCLIALKALDDVLFPLLRYVDHRLTDSAGYHRHASRRCLVERRWQLVGTNRRDGCRSCSNESHNAGRAQK